MAKLTKQEAKLFQEAEAILWDTNGRILKDEEIEFVLRHWYPDAKNIQTIGASFFTPVEMSLAMMQLEINHDVARVIDLCAGIGSLIYGLYHSDPWRKDYDEVAAIEINPEFVKVGKRLFPDVMWVEGDVFDLPLLQHLKQAYGPFDVAVSNPPFGNPPGINKDLTDWLSYQGKADLMVAEISIRIAERGGVMIMPQMSCQYGLSTPHHGPTNSRVYKKWQKATGGIIETSSLDTRDFEFRKASPLVEIVTTDGEALSQEGLPDAT